MTVFRGYMKMIKRNLPIMVLYFTVFICVSIGIQIATGEEGTASFEEKRLKIGVVDKDGGELAKGLAEYLGQAHQITLLTDDKGLIQEKLFYRTLDYVITIPKGFDEEFLMDGNTIKTTKVPGSYSAIYAEQRIDTFLNAMQVYVGADYSLTEAVELVIDQGKVEPKVEIFDINGNQGEIPLYVYMVKYYPYLFISAICCSISLVMLVFKNKEIKRRMQSAPVSIVRQNVEGILALAIVGVVFLMLVLLVTFLLYSKSMRDDPNLKYQIINIVLLLLVSFSIAFLIGTIAKNSQVVNNIVNGVSLGMCFLCGVFVPLDVMGDNVKKISQFLPVYWYEQNIEILVKYNHLTEVLQRQLCKGYGIQLFFAVACIGVGLVIGKYKAQES